MASSRENNPLPRLKAMEVLRELGVETASEIDVEAIAFHYGLRVYVDKLASARGRLVSHGRKGIIRISDNIPEGRQHRFIVAHELGHHLMHSSKGLTSVCIEADLVRYAETSSESDANQFAAELLMPSRIFEPRCDVARPSLTIVEHLAVEFESTLTSAAIRFVELCPEACALVWCQEGKIKWATKGKEFYAWIPIGSPPNSGTYAHDAIQGKPVRDALQLVDAEAWCERSRVEDIYEHTRYFSGLRATLTLLWAPSK